MTLRWCSAFKFKHRSTSLPVSGLSPHWWLVTSLGHSIKDFLVFLMSGSMYSSSDCPSRIEFLAEWPVVWIHCPMIPLYVHPQQNFLQVFLPGLLQVKLPDCVVNFLWGL